MSKPAYKRIMLKLSGEVPCVRPDFEHREDEHLRTDDIRGCAGVELDFAILGKRSAGCRYQ